MWSACRCFFVLVSNSRKLIK
uniref:Uncharacterized protein n=1 Tax=Rhizophora mucronata TaxID=61149 RepID=A0A2P2PAW7_RHIMU